MLDDPSILLRKLSNSYVAFSRGDIEREVLKLVHNDRDKYIALCQKMDFYLSSKMPAMFHKEVAGGIEVKFDSREVIAELEHKASGFADLLLDSGGIVNLGKGIGDVERFTSREKKESEDRVLSLIDEVTGNTDFISLNWVG